MHEESIAKLAAASGVSMQEATRAVSAALSAFAQTMAKVKVPMPMFNVGERTRELAMDPPVRDEEMVELVARKPKKAQDVTAAAELWKSRDDIAQQMTKAFAAAKPLDLNVFDSKVAVNSVACYWREDDAGYELLITCSKASNYGAPGPANTEFVIHRILGELEVGQFATAVDTWKGFVQVTWLEMAREAGLATQMAKLPPGPQYSSAPPTMGPGSGETSWYTATGTGTGPLAQATRARYSQGNIVTQSGNTTWADGAPQDTPENRKRTEEYAAAVADLKAKAGKFWQAIIKMNADAEKAMLQREEDEAMEILRRTLDERPN